MKSILKILFLALLVSGCSRKPEQPTDHSGMEMDMSEMVHLNEQQRKIINLQIDTAKLDVIYEASDFTGTIKSDENNSRVISARINGRIEKLFIRNIGEEIRKGQILFSVYSEELLSDQNEFIKASMQQSNFKEVNSTINTLIEASRNRLRLWGMSEEKIEELVHNQKVSAVMDYYNDENGYLSELNVSEGEYISPGMPLFKVSSLNTVWAEALVYQNELDKISTNAIADVTIPDLSGKKYSGKIIQNAPVFEGEAKTASIKVELQNSNGMIKPGMMAVVSMRKSSRSTLVIPKSALILVKMASVWIESKPGMYENRMVETGIENKTTIEILSGLKEGDKVVTSGSYLLNSAYILQNGANSMPGMEM